MLPTVATVAEKTPRNRDRSLDLIRIVSLLVVITGHGVMLLVSVDSDGLHFGNLLTNSPVLQALTWVLQVLPLFFFAGAASSAMGYTPGTNWGGWLLRRAQRLYRPVFYYVAAWVVALAVLQQFAAHQVQRQIAGLSVQLLWFIGVYVIVLAFVPAFTRMTKGWHLAMVVGGVYVAAAAVDWTRLHDGPSTLSYLNILVWLIPAALGVGYARGLVSRGAAATLAGAMFVVDVALVAVGPYELSLVTVEGQRLSNMTPPSLVLAGHAIVLSCLFIAIAPWCDRLARNARVWWLVAIGNGGAMTLYLWHMPALLLVTAVSHLLGYDRTDPAQPGFAALLVVQVLALYAVTAALFLGLQQFENRPLPWWDGAVTGNGAMTGIAVVIAGVANLLAAKWGLVGPGIWCTIVAAVALIVARALDQTHANGLADSSHGRVLPHSAGAQTRHQGWEHRPDRECPSGLGFGRSPG